MGSPGGNGDRILRKVLHGKRNGAIGSGAVAQLAIGVLAPAQDRAAGSQSAGVVSAGSDGSDLIRQGRHVGEQPI